MGVEEEDFIGNPNRIEFTDDELDYDDVEFGQDAEFGQVWFGLDHDDVDDDSIGLFYHDLDEEDEEDDEDDDYSPNDDDYSPGGFADEFSEDSDGELRVRLVNGSYVQVTSSTEDLPVAAPSSVPVESDIDNNEVVKPVEAPEGGAGSEVEVRPIDDLD